MKKTVTLIFLISVACSAKEPVTSNEQQRCKLLNKAVTDETKILKSESIKRLFEASQNSPQCDDGYYAEGISDILARTLAKDFKATVQLIAGNKNLKDFVVKHIDATADWNDLDKTIANAKKQCPKNQKELCSLIKNLAEKASKEAKAVK